MTIKAPGFAAVLACLLTSAASAQAPTQEALSFRAITDLVTVDVTIRSGRSAMKGLTAADFVLTDNGVRQRIDATTIELVPVDLTLILDVSDSTSLFIDDFKARAQRINEMLRPGDRVRLLTVAAGVTEVSSLQPGRHQLPVDGIHTRAGTAIDDALALSLVRPTDPGRRQLIIVFTDGMDTTSVIDAAAVRMIARQANAVLHLVLFGDYGERAPVETLREAAEQTGGEMYLPGRFDNAVDAFKQVFDDFRESYVLRYVPAGVKLSGWHEINVTLAKPSGRTPTIRAKKGYTMSSR